MNYHGQFRSFADVDFDLYMRERLELLKQGVRSENADYLLNVNEAEYVTHTVTQYTIEPLVLHFDDIEASSYEKMIPAELFPFNAFVTEGESYPKPVVKYHVPVSGNLDLLRCVPNPRVLDSCRVSLEGGAICFEIVDFSGSAEQIKREADRVIGYLKTQSGHLAANVAQFNASLQGEAETSLRNRKQELLKQAGTLAGLGVKIKKASDVPTTFIVPAQRKQITPKPQTTGTRPRVPDPTLEETIYQEILKTIHETGKVFERLPSTYAGKDEESLRDHLILQLEPRFEYSSTGETFNRSGKTDILVRHQKSNIFVAECKFWGGAKKHFETIDQILSYLTWRDSKTAIVYFMDTKEMAAPLRAIEESTSQHPCFVKFNGKKYDSWFDYTFHLTSDEGVLLRLSILCFHLPKQS